MRAEAYLVKDALFTFDLPLEDQQLIRRIILENPQNRYNLIPVDCGKGSDISLASKMQQIFSDEKEETKKELCLHLKSRSKYVRVGRQATLEADLDDLEVELQSVIFRNLLASLGDQMQLKLELRNPEVELATVNPPSPITTAILTWKPRDGNIIYSGNTDKFPQRWAEYWNTPLNINFSVRVSIIVCGNLVLQQQSLYDLPSILKGSLCLDDKKEDIPKKLLENKVATDTTIITEDGSKVECHKSFLIAQSEVFQTMLTEGKYKEGESQEIEMVDMTENGVKALLAFLYYRGLVEPLKDLKVATELLRAGNKYDISSLERAITTIIQQKPVEWFDITTTIQLFFFSKNVEQLAAVKLKCLEILKSKSEELTASDDYKQLFEDVNDAYRVAARELSTALINM